MKTKRYFKFVSIYFLAVLVVLSLSKCKESTTESPQKSPPPFDNLFYQNYRGFSAFYSSDAEYPKIHFFCCNSNSFFTIQKDGNINIRICGMKDSSGSIDFQTTGRIEVLNKKYVKQNGFNLAYWNAEVKIVINNKVSYATFQLIELTNDAWVHIEEVNSDSQLKIYIDGQIYFLISNLYKKSKGNCY